MELGVNRRWLVFTRVVAAAAVACALVSPSLRAAGQEIEISEQYQEVEESLSVEGPLFSNDGSMIDREILPPGEELANGGLLSEDSPFAVSGGPTEFDEAASTEPLGKHEHLRPFDYMRHWGFHHSSTDGRFMDKNVPMNYSSWLNRPFHVDWFAGPLLSDSPNETMNVKQTNALFGGLRFGWDFDYYWGAEWRFGWSDPEIFYEGSSVKQPGTYWVSDVNVVYYPWGDTRVRPFFVAGLGISEVGSLHNDGGGIEANLLGMPFGLGIQFQQTPWLVWRAEIMDNLAWGSEGVSTTHNVSFTAGMNIRYGARKPSYWPWRTSRHSW